MEIIKAQIEGLTASIEDLRGKERVFIKSNTLAESIEKARADKEILETELAEVKNNKTIIKDQKAEMLKSVCDPLAKKIDEFLPKGCAVINMDDGLYIGWNNEKSLTPYLGLSGGEKVQYDGALANALLGDSKNKVIVLEAGELDDDNLDKSLERLRSQAGKAQIIVNTCHNRDFDPVVDDEEGGWKVVRL